MADVVDLIQAQHAQIRRGFAKVVKGGPDRDRDWTALRRLLAVHETAEEAHVHPLVRKKVPGGRQIVRSRLREERVAKRLLRRLDRLGPRDPRFDAQLPLLRKAVLVHAMREEREELRLLRRTVTLSRRRLARLSAKLTKALGPTRPHPAVNAQLPTKLAAPVAAPVDRTRDAIAALLRRR
ncbi:MAG: hemerythrin domain-containing protein [Frankiaceae bacterium]